LTPALLLGLLASRPLLALDAGRTPRQYVHDVWMTEEGLPQATVKAVMQSRDGYLWVGTEEGLARFDGVRFVVFNSRSVRAFGDDHVLSLLEDRSGNLWIGTQGGLLRHRDGAFTEFAAKGLPSDIVYSLYEDRDDSLWIGARGGIARFRAGLLATNRDPAIAGRTIWSIHQDRSGTMWLGTDLYGLVKIERNTVTTYTTATGLPHDAIPVITELSDGRLIIGTNGAGLYEWSGGHFIPFRASGTLPSGAITALLEDSSRNLWVGTTAGLARISRGVISADAPGELGSSQINALAEDAEGSLWIGTTSAGLHRLRDGRAHTITSADGLPSDRAQVVLHDRSGGTWIGTRDGAAHLADGRVTTYSTANGLPNPSVRSLFQSSDGAIWLGTELGGVVRIANGRMQTTILDPHVPDNTIRAFAEEPGRGVWVGSNGGRLTLFVDGKPAGYSEYDSGGRRLFVRAMAVDKSGSLWIATDGNGLVHLVDGKLRKIYTRADGLSRDGLRSLYIDAGGTIWIGTDGSGLNRLKDGKITVYRAGNGLFDDRILQILEGDDGRIWMSSNNGISSVEKRALEAFAEGRIDAVKSLFIDDRDGMVTRDCSGGSQPAGAKKQDGTLWFPTDGGVAVVDPRRQHGNTHAPPVKVERVMAERTALIATESFEVPKGTRNLEIAYTALSLAVPERVQFRYKLEGYDEAWIDAGTRRTAYYTSLRPGQYRFRVIAANNDGVWNTRGASVGISLPPYFYQRPSFVLLVLALVAAGVWVAVTWRIRSIRSEAARTAEMERRLVGAQRMDALGQLASGIAHDFNNTLMAAYPWAELIRTTYPTDPMLQQASNRIVQAVERAKKVTSQLLDFAQPKQPEVTPFDLGDLAHDQVSMARAVLPPEIHLSLSVAGAAGTTGDQSKIGQVLLNLLLNASDAMPDGGRITVQVREPTAAEAESWHVQPGKMVLLSVSDTGTGIDPAVIPRIFDPFYTTKSVGKGTGLGLAVVDRIVRDHHGSVHVESEVDKGSTFNVLLPRSELATLQTVPPAVPETSKGALRGRTVFLVDDEAVTIHVVRGMLEMEGATVHVATVGEDALQQVDAGLRPDLVVLDLGLPDIPGEQVHAQLRRRFSDMPIIIASGYGDRDRLEPLLKDPRTIHLQKPYSMKILIEHVAKMTALPGSG
jgi:ligand-binding sensor domain-containing protein/signal transduction histidine kinase/CheY-like chemotaxis protein